MFDSTEIYIEVSVSYLDIVSSIGSFVVRIKSCHFGNPSTNTNESIHFRLCYVHNQVNARLHKPEFDCAHLDAEYDCGCGDAPINVAKGTPLDMDLERDPSKDDVTGVGLIKGGR